MTVDRFVNDQHDWDALVEDGLGVIIDPVVLRIGQLFLEGATRHEGEDERRWNAIESDIGALIAFFDLIVTRRRFPAFNYGDTFDRDLHHDPLGELVNAPNDKVIEHVDIEYDMYRLVKTAALSELERRVPDNDVASLDKAKDRVHDVSDPADPEGMVLGGLVKPAVAASILRWTTAVQYEWTPGLESLDARLKDEDERRVARFLLGQLIFSGYAQMTGAPHVLAPQRSLIMAAVGLQSHSADEDVESEIFDELRRRSKDAGAEFRVSSAPWKPSFLPLLVERAQSRRYKTGPDVLLSDAKYIRETPAMDQYRRVPHDIAAGGPRKTEARRELLAAARKIAQQLDSDVARLSVVEEVAVDVLPTAGAKVAGAVVGGFAAGPPGSALGAVAGSAAGKIVGRSQRRLFGFAVEGLTIRRAHKLLTRAALADFAMRRQLVRELRIIWESPRASRSR